MINYYINFSTCGFKIFMINFKKKIIRIKQKLYKNCVKNINHSLID
jgi:hypothetical protein